MAKGSAIVSVGAYRPLRTVPNAALPIAAKVTAEWMVERIGITSRRFAAEGETVVDMATASARAALRAAGVAASEVDLVMVATCSAESAIPNAAAPVAARLGLTVPAFDLNAACSGFCYGLALADSMIRAGTCRTALVIGAEKMSAWVDPDDGHTAAIFADGAGAALVAASGKPSIGPVVWGSDGSRGDFIEIPSRSELMRMNGPSVYRWAVTQLAPYARKACEAAGIEPQRLAGFVPHQANLRIVRALARELGIEGEVAEDIVEAGNTSAASIPLALARLCEGRRVRPGDPVLLLGFGAGLTYAGQVVGCPQAAATSG